MNSSDKFWIKNEIFDEYLKKSGGDRFEAICKVSNDARMVADSLDGSFIDSHLLAYVLGKSLDSIHSKHISIKSDAQLLNSVPSSVLDHVNDPTIIKAVRKSINESLQQFHLIYCYNDISDESMKSRVRILTKIFWNNLFKNGEEK